MSKKANKEERNLAVIMHLSPLLGILFPLLGFIVPIAIWFFKKDESRFIDDRGKEILNFIITGMIIAVVSFTLTFVLVGFLLIGAFFLYFVVISIISAIKTSDGEDFRYPAILRLIK